MIRECHLVFQNYEVDTVKPGMLYLTFVHPTGWQVTKIDKAPLDSKLYILDNGHPVKPWIIDIGNPNKPGTEEVLASPDQIGWFDEGEHSDELCDIELKHMNNILEKYDGWVFLEVDDKDKPVLFMDKITLSYADDLDIEEDVDDDDDQPIDYNDDYNNIF